jgi:hypothetical protein
MLFTRGAAAHPRVARGGGARSTAVARAFIGLAWLAIAGGCAWLAFATPALGQIMRLDVASPANPVVGIAVLAVAMVAPAGFAIVGMVRLADALTTTQAGSATRSPVSRMADRLPAGCHVIPRIRLPDGRRIPDVVVGPHGIAILEPLPPAEAARRSGERWEVRFDDGRWHPIECPLQRAARDAERLRSHLGAEELDVVVRVQAAVIGDPAAVRRTESCAVVALADVPAWLAALPAQRGLSDARLAGIRASLERLA